MARWWLPTLLLLVVILDGIVCPPVQPPKDKKEAEDHGTERDDDDPEFGLEYERYLKEVVGVLESDEGFRQQLQNANVSEIKSGEIARHLEFVNHNIRTKLDELKRKEVDRLRLAMKLQAQMERGMKQMGHEPSAKIDTKAILGHLDHSNPNTFEVEDLAKLIKQASNDLEQIDQQRKTEFKNYELEKELEQRQKLKGMDEKHRKEEEGKIAEMEKRHKDHPKLHHPGSKDQLEEVWEEDGMEKEDFDPKTFFKMHDQNEDGVLDEPEVEALFQHELDKMYDPKNPDDDQVERYEEMNRMREHVFGEIDKNHDKVISVDEFLQNAKGEEFEKDEGWKGLDEEEPYSDDEMDQYVKDYEDKQHKDLEEQGHYPPADPSAIPLDHDNESHDNLGQGHHDQGQGHDQGQPIQMDQAHHDQQQAPVGHQGAAQGQDLKFQQHQPPAQGPGHAQGQDQGHELPQNPRVPTNV